jgi:enoyl-CoA hydratase/carnithine racemase
MHARTECGSAQSAFRRRRGGDGNLISASVAAGVGHLVLDRPEKRNAIARAMWEKIPDMVMELEQNDTVRVIMLRGTGAHFAAGADIAEFDELYATRASAAAYADMLARAMDALCGCRKPRLAVIRGVCVGAGVALVTCCDLRFADDTARFAVTPAKLGIAYSFEDTRRLVACVGPAAARDMLFSGRMMAAEEALRLRLIDRVHAAGALQAAADTYAAALRHVSRGSIAVARDFIDRAVAGQLRETEQTRAAYLDLLEQPDFSEGKRAFKEKRPPRM